MKEEEKKITKKSTGTKKVGRPKKETTEKTTSKNIKTKKTTKSETKRSSSSEKKVIKAQAPILETKKEEQVLAEKEESVKMLPKKEGENVTSSKKETSFKTPEIIILTVLTCFVSLFVGMSIATKTCNKETKKEEPKNSSELQELIQNYQYIKKRYEDKVNEKQLLNGAINGMLGVTGDPYASMVEKDSNLEIQLNGSFVGIGIEMINNNEGNIQIMTVFKGSPAERAGMQPGDILKSINDFDLIGQPTTALSTYIKGEKGKSFDIVFLRGEEEINRTIEKELVIIPSVVSEMMERNGKKIGYIDLTIFSATTPNQFKKALVELEQNGMDSLIIDVRDNVGGRLDAVTEMLSNFLNSKHLIYQEEIEGKLTKTYSEGTVDKTYPIVVLMNSNSASSSEILASALQEQANAKLIGTKSYGKGTVQRLKELKNGDQYKTTIGKWLTSKGVWINEVGLIPDMEVELSEEYYQNPSNETDNQLQSALDYLGK